MPHHEVIGEDNATTKLRIVFDASAAVRGARSLNQNLYKGTTPWNAFEALLQLRQGEFAVTAQQRRPFCEFLLGTTPPGSFCPFEYADFEYAIKMGVRLVNLL